MASVIAKKAFILSRYLKTGLNETTLNNQYRFNSVLMSKLIYNEYGDPLKVVKKIDEKTEYEVKPDEVVIKMIASPVNPADINTIQGKYPVKPVLPSVPGNEGVGEVIAVGSKVLQFAEGDRVVPLTNASGTWQSHLILSSNELYKVPKKLGIIEAATLTVNPCTAFRMLRDFVALKPGDTVIQNGANSAVGQNVIQIARVWGLRTVNIVRNRSNITELKKFLTDLGGTYILTEEEIRTTDIFKTGKVKRPKLALNCVGGKSALELTRQLDSEGTMVTYGGMSREPVTIPTGPLIFKDIKLRGFWMTQWSKKNADNPDRKEMFEEIISMMTNGEMHGPVHSLVPLNDYKEALSNTISSAGMVGRKFILQFQ